jgi:hypothetical protein
MASAGLLLIFCVWDLGVCNAIYHFDYLLLNRLSAQLPGCSSVGDCEWDWGGIDIVFIVFTLSSS